MQNKRKQTYVKTPPSQCPAMTWNTRSHSTPQATTIRTSHGQYHSKTGHNRQTQHNIHFPWPFQQRLCCQPKEVRWYKPYRHGHLQCHEKQRLCCLHMKIHHHDHQVFRPKGERSNKFKLLFQHWTNNQQQQLNKTRNLQHHAKTYGTERMCANTTPSTPTPNTTGLDTVLGIVGGNRPPHKDFLGTQPNVRSADLP